MARDTDLDDDSPIRSRPRKKRLPTWALLLILGGIVAIGAVSAVGVIALRNRSATNGGVGDGKKVWPRKDWPGKNLTRDEMIAKFGRPDSTIELVHPRDNMKYALWIYNARSIDTDGSGKIDREAIVTVEYNAGPGGADLAIKTEFR